MQLSKKYSRIAAGAAAALNLATAFGATSAQAVDFQPSPDNKFEHCVTSAEFPQALQDMGQRAIASWDNLKTETGRTSWYTKAILSIDANEVRNSQKKWVTWSGWDENEALNGKKPALFCVNSNGKGMQVLEGSMPENPFDYTYQTPANPIMGTGKMFYKNFVRGELSADSHPVILTNIGNKNFMTFYTEPSRDITISATESNGATKPTVTGSNFQFPDNIKKELLKYEEPQPSF